MLDFVPEGGEDSEEEDDDDDDEDRDDDQDVGVSRRNQREDIFMVPLSLSSLRCFTG